MNAEAMEKTNYLLCKGQEPFVLEHVSESAATKDSEKTRVSGVIRPPFGS